MDLKNTAVFRGGVTSRYQSRETKRVSISTYRPDQWHQPNAGVLVSFSISSKGGGSTQVNTYIDSSDFGSIALQMVNADRESAIAAFANALLGTDPRAS
ncbi:hypothetical protein [Rhizobium leguminosarum]